MMTQKRQKDPTGPLRPYLDTLALSMEAGDLLFWDILPGSYQLSQMCDRSPMSGTVLGAMHLVQ